MVSKEFRWWFLPYCLDQLEKGKYVILNRAYKPVGMVTDEWVEYEPHAVKIKMTPKMAESLSCDKDPDIKRIYLYSDGSVPTSSPENMKKYLAKISKLAAYKVS